MDVSIVFTMFNEQENVDELFVRLAKVSSKTKEKWEVIAVDNGSNDDTPIRLKNILNDQSKTSSLAAIKVITLVRNFGYDNAIISGIENAIGKKIVIMDGDIQDPPEEIPKFLRKMKEGFEVVYGIRKKRTETLIIRFFIAIFYQIWSKIEGGIFPKKVGNFCVISQRVAAEIKDLPERTLYFRGIRAWLGYKSVGIEYERLYRKRGKTKFSFFKYLGYAITGLTSFTTFPLRLLTILGSIGILFSIISGIYVVVLKLLLSGDNISGNNVASGWSSIMVFLLASISINLLGLGLLGEYISRVFEEVKGRPRAIVESITQKK